MLTVAPNRFRPTLRATADAAAPGEGARRRPTDVVRFSRAQAAALLTGAGVMSRRLTTDEFIAKVREAKQALVDAPSFDLAFQDRILRDPILASAFAGYLQAIQSGQLAADDTKKRDAEVVFNRQQIVRFLATFEETLAATRAEREATPPTLAEAGLRLVQRAADIQDHAEHPLEQAAVIRQLLQSGLPADAEATLAARLARSAVQELSLPENRTPEARSLALDNLDVALRALAARADQGDVFRRYFGEMQRIAAELDGGPMRASHIRTEAVRLASASPADQKAAAARLGVALDALLTRRAETAAANAPLSNEDRNALLAWTAAASSSRALAPRIAEVAQVIAGPVDGAGAPIAYVPPQGEVEAKATIVVRHLIGALGQRFPSLAEPADREAHLAQCDEAQGLLLELVGRDNSDALAPLAVQLARHPERAQAAVELLSADLMPHPAGRLAALASVAVCLLETGQVDRALAVFRDPLFDQARGTHDLASVGDVLAAATAAAAAAPAGAPETKEWLATAHLRAIENATKENGPLLSLRGVLASLARGALDAESAVDVVSKVEERVPADMHIMPLLPGLLDLLGPHADSPAAQAKAKELLELGRALSTQNRSVVHDGALRFDASRTTVELAQAASRHEMLSGYVRPLVEQMIREQSMWSVRQFFDLLPSFGRCADKAELAGLWQVPDAYVPEIALSLARDPTTTSPARALIQRFAAANLGRELKDLSPEDRAAFMTVEAAARLAVPNLMTKEAVGGLFRAFQAKEVRAEAVHTARVLLPRELIDQVCKEIGDAELDAFLAAGHEADAP